MSTAKNTEQSCWGCGMDWKTNAESRQIVRMMGLTVTKSPDDATDIAVCPPCYEEVESQRPQAADTPPVKALFHVIEAESGSGGNCLLGEGTTWDAAWEDALGPKPWSLSIRRAAKKAWSRIVTAEELESLKTEQATR